MGELFRFPRTLSRVMVYRRAADPQCVRGHEAARARKLINSFGRVLVIAHTISRTGGALIRGSSSSVQPARRMCVEDSSIVIC